jgi:X-X-X-Leu-X-X-Gly heptad repeat protein
VALDAGTTSRARDAFSLIYEETIDAVFAIESALEPLAGPPAPLPWEIKGLRNAQASSPAAAGYRRAGKTSCAAMMSDLYQRFQMSNPYQRDEVACGAPQDKFPVHTDTNPISKPENAFEAAAEEAARAAGSSQIASGSSQIACGSSQIAAGSSQIAW